MSGKYLLTTLGCKVNQYESQQIREVLESLGLRPAHRGEVADVAVVNTCAVTAGASRKSRQAIRRLACGGRTRVVVVGCGATADGARLNGISGVTAVLEHQLDTRAALRMVLTRHLDAQPTPPAGDATATHHRIDNQPDASGNEVWMKPRTARRDQECLTPQAANSRYGIPALPVVKPNEALTGRIETFAGHQRAFLKVQDGCDACCTYCIIPRLRRRLRSKPIEIAVAEAGDLVRAGHKEIVVTGIFLGAYGRETAVRKRWGQRRSPLADLIRALARVDGLVRLRLSSLEPGDVDEALLDVLATHEACVPHLHVSLQSGSPQILRRMNRQYTADAFMAMIDRVRAALDRPAITTDVIVGFPKETEQDFQATTDVARYAEFCKIHAFPFSPRERTAAARWRGDFVPIPVVRERMERLAELERECSLVFRRRFVGEIERVIVEGPEPVAAAAPRGGRSSDGSSSPRHCIHYGRADRYFGIHFETTGGCCDSRRAHGHGIRPRDVVSVRIDRVTPARTHGTCVTVCADSYPLHVLSNTGGH